MIHYTQVCEQVGPWPCRTCGGEGVVHVTSRDYRSPCGLVYEGDVTCGECMDGHQPCSHCGEAVAVIAVPDGWPDPGGTGTRVCESDECLRAVLPRGITGPGMVVDAVDAA